MTTTVVETGIVDGMPNHEYHAHDSLSATGLKILATQTPAHYRWKMDNPEHKAAFDLGTAAHSLVLEDDHSHIVVVDADSWRTKAAQQQRDDAYEQGKVPLLVKDYQMVKTMHDSVAGHPLAKIALEGGKAEQSIFWDDPETGTRLRCRPDKLDLESRIGPLIIDLKTTVNADPREFGKTTHNLGYHQQAAHYLDGVKATTGADAAFLFVLVEKTAPYLVSVVELDAEALDIGRAKNRRAISIYNQCKTSGEWPGYPTSEPVNLPIWATRED